MAPLITWEEEPGWDSAVVVSSYKVSPSKKQGEKTTVTVTFDVLGLLQADDFIFGRKSKSIDFSLVRTHAEWKIAKPMILPHISVDSARNNIHERLGTFKSSPSTTPRMRKLEKILQQLEGLSKSR